MDAMHKQTDFAGGRSKHVSIHNVHGGELFVSSMQLERLQTLKQAVKTLEHAVSNMEMTRRGSFHEQGRIIACPLNLKSNTTLFANSLRE